MTKILSLAVAKLIKTLNLTLEPQRPAKGVFANRLKAGWVPVEEFMAMPDHRSQRDYKTRIGKKHLRKAHATHAIVHAVIHPVSGEIHKVDGHTRAYLWSLGPLESPLEVFLVIHTVDNMEEYDKLYWTFDSPWAAELSREMLTGLLRRRTETDGFTPFERPYLRDGKWVTVLTYVHGLMMLKGHQEEFYDAILEWNDELVLLDQFPKAFFKAPMTKVAVLAAVLLSLRMYGAAVMPFWVDVSKNMGKNEPNPDVKPNSKNPLKAAYRWFDSTYRVSAVAGVVDQITKNSAHPTEYMRGSSGRTQSEDNMLEYLELVDDHMSDKDVWYPEPAPVRSRPNDRTGSLIDYRDRAALAKEARKTSGGV